MSNILVNSSGILKIADFGLAKVLRRQSENAIDCEEINATNRIVTLWTRAPELVLGSTQYGCEIDMWSTGCIIYELLIKTGPFNGQNELAMVAHFKDFFGEQEISDLQQKAYPWSFMIYSSIYLQNKQRRLRKREEVAKLNELEGDIVLGLLNMDPVKRLSAKDCLAHDYFKPKPEIVAFEDSLDFHEQRVKSERNKQRKNSK